MRFEQPILHTDLCTNINALFGSAIGAHALFADYKNKTLAQVQKIDALEIRFPSPANFLKLMCHRNLLSIMKIDFVHFLG